MAGSVLQQKSPFKIKELSFSSKFDWGSHIISIISKKIGALICSIRFFLQKLFLQKLLCISINLPCDLSWNIFVMSRPVHRNVGPSIAVSLEPLVHHPNAASLKVVSAIFLLVCFVCLKNSTCETRKNVFYFTSKTLFVLEIIKF